MASESQQAPLVPSGVLGMLIFIAMEMMFFAGLVSAFAIIRAGAVVWPPPGQPRLPIEETAFNTAALLLSGAMLFAARRAFRRDRGRARIPLLISILLGAFFVLFQGVEWVSLIGEGLTLTSSSLGSFFYLIVGMHALHAVAAILVLCQMYLRLTRAELQPGSFQAVGIFWYFVVGLWPILYVQVYL